MQPALSGLGEPHSNRGYRQCAHLPPQTSPSRLYRRAMTSLCDGVDRIAADTGFSGVVRVDRQGSVAVEAAYGLASRAFGVPNTSATRFAVASVTKGLTACTVISLVDEGVLSLQTTARSLLGDDLPLIAADVTVEHLLAHRSGIGDYFDEEAGGSLDDYPPPPPGLVETEDYLPALDGYATKFPAGQRFSYCNSGYVVLALLAERAGGRLFRTLVQQRVCEPAGMTDTAFLRSDELPAGTACGYVDAAGLRTNVFRVPVRGSGDGGIFTTVADLAAFWRALFAGQIVRPAWVAEMVRPHSDVPAESMQYGLGFWLRASSGAVQLEGHDLGASCRSVHHPAASLTMTVMSNTSDGAWPVARHLDAALEEPDATDS
jgi:CubicO group peptidase (beta-lactamase class C family)